MSANPQIAVCFDRKGHTLVYDVVYTEAQVRPALDRCIAAHGREANVRTITAPDFPLKAKA